MAVESTYWLGGHKIVVGWSPAGENEKVLPVFTRINVEGSPRTVFVIAF